MSKNFNLRKDRLNGLVGTTQHFVGKIARGTSYKAEEGCKMLICPLYVEVDGAYSYIEHTWMVLPEEYSSKIGYTIDFFGEVYSYKKENGIKSYGINFSSVKSIEKVDLYNELKMNFVESTSEDRKERRYVNGNLSVIAAFENGEDLHVSRKGRDKKFAQRIKMGQRLGKRAEDAMLWNTLAWNVL